MEQVFKVGCDANGSITEIPHMDGLYTFLCYKDLPKEQQLRRAALGKNHQKMIHKIQVCFVMGFLLFSALIASCVFVGATILVYLLIPKLRNLHGKTLLCYLGAMLAASAALSYVQLEIRVEDKKACKGLGKSNF